MRPKRFKTILIIILILLVVFGLNKLFGQTLKNSFFSFFAPLQKFLWQQSESCSNLFNGFFNSKILKIENENLRKENFIFKNEILRLKSFQQENETLRKALEIELQKDFKLILVNVLSKKSEEDSILINRGEKDGVLAGMPLISEEKVLIGKVGKVFSNFSQVDLISKKDFIFSVEVQNEENSILGAIRGQGNFRIKIELLPKDAQVKPGDMVSTSMLGGIFPKNLLVGEIKSIDKAAPKTFQQGEVMPYFRKIDLEQLFLISKIIGVELP